MGLQLSDDRSITCTGWFAADIDPRPLLPGERREFTVDRRDDAGPRRLNLET